MRIIKSPKVYLIARPQIVEEGLNAFLEEQGLDWPTPTEGVTDAERLVEAAGRCCFDDITEVLTCEGWKLFRNLNREEQVLTRDSNGNVVWQVPHAYQEYDFSGKMFVVDGRDVSFSVTPEHRLYGAIGGESDLGFIAANELKNKQFKIPVCGSWEGVVPDSISIPNFEYTQSISNKYGNYGSSNRQSGERIWTEFEDIFALAKLLVYYVTEGSLRNVPNSGQGIRISGNHCEDIKNICSKLDIPVNFGVDPRNNCPFSNIGGGIALREYFEDQCGKYSVNKKLPHWVLNLPTHCLTEIWEILVNTDGHHYENNREVLISTSVTLCGQAQEVLCKLNFGSNLLFESAGVNHPVYRVSRKQNKNVLINKNAFVSEEEYTGKVYCVSTENGIIFVRRNGKPHFSGNCYMSFGKKAGSKTNAKYLENLIGFNSDGTWKPGPAHGSVCEHPTWSFLIVGAGRGFSHEQVRHRTGWAYSQLSTRYCDFEREEEEGTWEPGFCIPPLSQLSEDASSAFDAKLHQSQQAYCELLALIERDLQNNPRFMETLAPFDERERKRMLRKAARGAARDILPIATEAIMVMSANARAVWNCIVLRGNEHAEAVIRDVYVQIAKIMEVEMPSLFKGVKYEECWDGTQIVVMPRDKL